jgi:uncharacterized protein
LPLSFVRSWSKMYGCRTESTRQPHCYHQFVPTPELLALIAVFFATSLISVVTGSTSLITVPVMIQFGIEPHVAVATNMMALIFMSVGGSLPFARKGVLPSARLPGLIVVTVLGSALGAFVLLAIPKGGLELVIAVAMIGVACFTLIRHDAGATAAEGVSQTREIGGYAAAFLLAIYGGFFSGGYVTLLTTAFVFLFGMTFLQSVAITKVVNVFSSAVAVLIFAWRGAVDYKLGTILGIAMFLGAMIGAHTTMKISPVWLRRSFIAVVLGLAVKMLFNFVQS